LGDKFTVEFKSGVTMDVEACYTKSPSSCWLEILLFIIDLC